jgi:hypothetical protein
MKTLALFITRLDELVQRPFHALPPAWSAIPLRLIVGYGFMEHGYAKIAHGPDAFAAILGALGVPAPHWMAWATIAVELLANTSRRNRNARCPLPRPSSVTLSVI